MQKLTQNLSLPTQQRQKVAIAGGGRSALETMALLIEDPATEVVCIWEPDRTALVFRLGDLGFNFADQVTPKLLIDLNEFKAISALDLIVDTTTNSQIRRSLDPFLSQGVRILSGQAAQLLWEVRLGKTTDQGQIQERLRTLLDGVDLVHDATELFEVLLQMGLQLTHSQSAAIYLVKPTDPQPYLVYATTPASGMRSANGLDHPDHTPFNSALVQKSLELKKPMMVPEEEAAVRAKPAQSNGYTQNPALILPLQQDGEVMGALEFTRDSSKAIYTPQDIEACTRLASTGARYFRKILSLQEMRELSLTEVMRAEIKTIVNSQLSFQEKLTRGAEKIREVLGCHSHFYVKDHFSDGFILQASTTQASQVCGMLRIRSGDGLVGEVTRSHRPVFLKGEVPGSPWGRRQALVYLPLQTSAGLWGVLCIEQLFLGPEARKVLKLLEEAAETFALVIASDLEHHRMSQKLLRLSVVQEEGLELLSMTDRDRVATMITASAAMLVDAEAVILRVFEKKGKRLLVGSTYGLQRNETDTKLVELDGLIALKAFQARTVQTLEEFDRGNIAIPSKFPYRYGVCRPIVYEGTTVGTLSAYNKLALQSFGCTPFDQDDLEILEKFSFYAGKALMNLHEAQARSALITIDEITGLRNERYLMMRLPEEIRRADRYHRSLSLMMFEIQSEAKVPPTPGSQEEKEFIKQVGEVLQEKFRNVDILVRMKGPRFAILMPDTGETVTDAAARLARGLSFLPLKIFMGYSTYPSDAKTVQELIGKAAKLSEMAREV